MAKKPARAVAKPVATSPATYSLIFRGELKKLIKFCDQISSKKVVITPCWTRVKKSHRIIAPKTTLTKLKVAAPKVLKYLLMNPQRIISIKIHRNTATQRMGLLLNK